ncbi:hypothetical protein ACHAXN_007399 [Cyclotella atomus]
MITAVFFFALYSRWIILSAADDQYGVDTSFPIHHNFLTQSAQLDATKSVFGHHRIQTYSEFFSGCLRYYGKMNKAYLCHQHEEQRLTLNKMQPRKMTNYTDVGFVKTKVSDDVWKMIQQFWKKHVDRVDGNIPWGLHNESWPEGNTYTNHWTSPTKLVPIMVDPNATEAIYKDVESQLRVWIPQATSFRRSNIYGIRVYTSGSILAPHVDRDPLVSSAIINVDQRVVEPWPLEAYDHEGRAHNLTLLPGEMILYESHSVLHGRPFALQGEYYANIFVHFKPEFDQVQANIDNGEL